MGWIRQTVHEPYMIYETRDRWYADRTLTARDRAPTRQQVRHSHIRNHVKSIRRHREPSLHVVEVLQFTVGAGCRRDEVEMLISELFVTSRACD